MGEPGGPEGLGQLARACRRRRRRRAPARACADPASGRATAGPDRGAQVIGRRGAASPGRPSTSGGPRVLSTPARSGVRAGCEPTAQPAAVEPSSRRGPAPVGDDQDRRPDPVRWRTPDHGLGAARGRRRSRSKRPCRSTGSEVTTTRASTAGVARVRGASTGAAVHRLGAQQRRAPPPRTPATRSRRRRLSTCATAPAAVQDARARRATEQRRRGPRPEPRSAGAPPAQPGDAVPRPAPRRSTRPVGHKRDVGRQVGQRLVADAVDLEQLVDRRERAVGRAPLQDLLGGDRARRRAGCRAAPRSAVFRLTSAPARVRAPRCSRPPRSPPPGMRPADEDLLSVDQHPGQVERAQVDAASGRRPPCAAHRRPGTPRAAWPRPDRGPCPATSTVTLPPGAARCGRVAGAAAPRGRRPARRAAAGPRGGTRLGCPRAIAQHHERRCRPAASGHEGHDQQHRTRPELGAHRAGSRAPARRSQPATSCCAAPGRDARACRPTGATTSGCGKVAGTGTTRSSSSSTRRSPACSSSRPQELEPATRSRSDLLL